LNEKDKNKLMAFKMRCYRRSNTKKSRMKKQEKEWATRETLYRESS